MAAFLALGAGQVGAPAVMADGHDDLFGKAFVEFGGLFADVIFEIRGVQFGLGEITGKEELAYQVNDIDDGLV